MELAAILIAAIVGWQVARLGPREWKGLALVVVGWSAVLAVASVPYLTLGSLAVSLIYHALIVVGPYALAVLARRIKDRAR
jgi:hypothetical protein